MRNHSSFKLRGSLPSIRAGKFIPPSPDPFATTQKFSLDTWGAKSSIFGVLVFSDQEGNQAFVVICGLSSGPTILDLSQSINGERGVDVRAFLSHGWWQEAGSSPFCLVLSWKAFTVVAEPGESDDSEDDIRLNGRSLVGLARRFSAQLGRFVLRENSALELDVFQVKARIRRVTSLQRQSMQVSVEIVRKGDLG